MGPSIVTKPSPCSSCGRQQPSVIQVCPSLVVNSPRDLKRYGPEVKRTRDPAILDTCDVVVDVGGVYDESKQRFDHHQRGFTQVFGHGFGTKLSSAGLVYKYVFTANYCPGYHIFFPCQTFWPRSYCQQTTVGARSFHRNRTLVEDIPGLYRTP